MSENQPAGALPESASVLWDLSMKRYDVLRGYYDAMGTRSLIFIGAAQGLIAAHALVISKLLASTGRWFVMLVGLVSTFLYAGATYYGYQGSKTRDVNPLPLPTQPHLLDHVEKNRLVFLQYLVKNYLEPLVNADVRRLAVVKSACFDRALAFVVAQAVWLFLMTVVPLCLGITKP